MPKSNKTAAPTYAELLLLLNNLAENVDSDCPQSYRTRHLKDALLDVRKAVRAANNTPTEKKAAKPTVYINLTGGCVHEIRTTAGLEDVLFIFAGDINDCDPDNRVPLTKDGETFVYTTGAPDENDPLSAGNAAALHKAAQKYNGL